MLAKLIQFSLTQRLIILLLSVLIIAGGWISFQNTPIDAYPDVSTTQVKIILKAPGMTPEEIESRITSLIEVEMLGLPHQSMLRSISKYALTDITIDFEEGTDIYWARQQVSERLNAIMEDLPSGVSGGIAPMTTPLGEMFMFTIEGNSLSLTEKRSLLDWVIRPALRVVPGVADVNALGGLVKTFEVIPDNVSLSARGLSVADLMEAIEQNNKNDGAGRLNEGEEVLLVRTSGSIQQLSDLKDIIVRNDLKEPVRVSDVAQVSVGAITRYGGVTANGKGEAVEGLVLGLRGANAQDVVMGVRAKLVEIEKSLPDDVSINIFYDRGKLIDKAIWSVSKALGEAIILVLLLLLIFLGDIRVAMTVAIILPLAALATFIMMNKFGMSANLMSLGGLAIAIGILVDAAVVVVENIVSHLAHDKKSRLPRLHLIYRAVCEVSLPVTSGMLIIVIVFLPLLSLQGLEGKLFSPVAMTIVFALTASLLLSLTVIPVAASYLPQKISHKETRFVSFLQRKYMPILAWALKNTRTVTAASVILLVSAAVIYTQVGKIFLPTMDEGDVIVQIEKLPSITLEKSLELDNNIQKILMSEVPEVAGMVARAGSDELGLDPMGLNETDGFLVLKPEEEWTVSSKAELIEKIGAVMVNIPGVAFNFTQPIEMRVSEMLTGVRGDIAIKIFGEDQNTLNQISAKLIGLLEKIEGADNVYKPANEGAQYLRLTVDRMAAGRLGLSVEQISELLRTQVEGRHAGLVYEGARRTPLVIRGPESIRNSPADFENLLITLPEGRRIPLSMVTKIERVEGPVSVQREKGSRMVVVIANVGKRDLVGFVEEAKALVAQDVALPSGYSLEWGGQFENQQRAAKRLGVVVPVALGLIFLLLFITFKSVRQALLVLSNIPFAMTGGIIALWLSGEYLSVPASVGFIALLGIAVLNGVVMVSYFNQLCDLGKPIAEVIILGAQRRLRPVLMTASIAAFGLVPLLFASGPGSEIQRPLAIVVIGGLVTSTLLTLILLPILYRRFGVALDHGSEE
ncbi:efflux RND transporter permease subunit [Paremcibacter congregatus]|uniref:CusA/CzcA family heavy metal efflux RND transporter n=1 Tax=Paremcibacter congregatus TaxID=2043170 RepID=A0A2G4YVZ8_9PROT|nr:CusA/CzcA family heavy metal efflux RND transporter [Paremcibacter congregatus]PHZ86507.1 CusA/CzcA family heavy metal efflux RND transporter [Paremcibacter congregatus]QDE26310.1 efflux RND transporter permease subunit [Paremcibacter congregatus]